MASGRSAIREQSTWRFSRQTADLERTTRRKSQESEAIGRFTSMWLCISVCVIPKRWATRVDLALDKAFVSIDCQDPYTGMSLTYR